MMPSWPFKSPAFTSGTTSGTSGSIRQAELSSMQMAPECQPLRVGHGTHVQAGVQSPKPRPFETSLRGGQAG